MPPDPATAARIEPQQLTAMTAAFQGILAGLVEQHGLAPAALQASKDRLAQVMEPMFSQVACGAPATPVATAPGGGDQMKGTPAYGPVAQNKASGSTPHDTGPAREGPYGTEVTSR
eukprot:11159504-Karenia_brevis.AAC.1